MRKEPPPPPRSRPRELPPSLPRSSPSSPKARRRPAPTAAFPASLVRRAAGRDSQARLRPKCPRIQRPSPALALLAPRPASEPARARAPQPARAQGAYSRRRDAAAPRARRLRPRGARGRPEPGDLARGLEGARPAGDAGRSGYRSSQALVLRSGFACPSCGKPGSGSRAKREGTANEWGRVRVPDSQKAR